MLPHVTGFANAPNHGARTVFARAVESGRHCRINPSAARASVCTANSRALTGKGDSGATARYDLDAG